MIWAVTVIVAIVAWLLGYRRGRRRRESDVEFGYLLGIEEGRRQRDRTMAASSNDDHLTAQAAAEVASMQDHGVAWINDPEGG